MSVKIIEENERFPCVSCGDRLCYEKGYGPEFGLCSECAETIANLYSIAHTGEPLTWPRARRDPVRAPVPQDVKWAILRRDGFRCKSCGSEGRPLHVDHVLPVSKGGSDNPENLQALCDKCNLRKGAK